MVIVAVVQKAGMRWNGNGGLRGRRREREGGWCCGARDGEEVRVHGSSIGAVKERQEREKRKRQRFSSFFKFSLSKKL